MMALHQTLFVALVTLLQIRKNVSAAAPPNILILFVDDWGWGDMGLNCLTSKDVPGANPDLIDKETSCDTKTQTTLTPHMDSIAKNGMRFTDFHAGAAVCTPSRAALQTGRMGARTGVITNFQPGSLFGLPLQEKTIAEILKPVGYHTCAIGKWHLGPQGKYQPSERGYDRYLGIPESIDYGCTDTAMGAPDSGCLHWQHDRCPKNKTDRTPGADQSGTCHPGPINPWNYSIPLMLDETIYQQPADIDGTTSGISLVNRYATFASEFITNSTQMSKPFLVYIGFSHMHVPVVYSPKYAGKSGKGILSDALMELDDAVGRILVSLTDNGATEDTIIFLTGDNGPPEDQCDWGGSKGPFMGQWQKTGQNGGSAGKMTSWEGGHREVGVISYPASNIPRGSVSHALTSTLDIVPTCAALANVSLPLHRDFDGMDLAPVLFDGKTTAHEYLFFSVGGEAYLNHNTTQSPLLPTGLFEAVRLADFKAMYKVGYMPQCCRGANGDANTPYNATCAKGGALGFTPTWLKTPLLFDLTVDVAESTPIPTSSPKHAMVLQQVQAVLATMQESLATDMIDHADYRSDLSTKICCNKTNVVCRCHET
eukprot:m.149638 g.149638  ORF g.149638 m.149638 type:complete len:596 (-) comp30673_c0_seq1:57-1844(-)